MTKVQTAVRFLAMVVIAAGCVLLIVGVATVVALATLLLLVSLAGPTPPGMPDLAMPVGTIAGVSAAGHALLSWWARRRTGAPRRRQPAPAAVAVAAVWLLVLAVLTVAEAALLFPVAYTVVSMAQGFPDPLMALAIVSAAVVNICAMDAAPARIVDTLLPRYTSKEESCDT